MLIYALLLVLESFVGVFFFFLPVVTLPVEWTNAISYVASLFHSFLAIFPHAEIVWNTFIFVIIPFELVLIVAKVILGSRVPAHTN